MRSCRVNFENSEILRFLRGPKEGSSQKYGRLDDGLLVSPFNWVYGADQLMVFIIKNILKTDKIWPFWILYLDITINIFD